MSEPYQDPDHAIPYLKLIKLGVPTWNKWIKGELTREEAADLVTKLAPTPVPEPPSGSFFDSENPVNFSCVDFTKDNNNNITFAGAEFNNFASFCGTAFGDQANFEGATLGHFVDFQGATFGKSAKFQGAKFGEFANFQDARFGPGAVFLETSFGSGVKFQRATFNNFCNFQKTIFSGAAYFQSCKIDAEVSFENAIFASLADFSQATIKVVSFQGVRFVHAVHFINTTFVTKADFNSAVFLHSDFTGCTFGKFAIFTNATFLEPPEFDEWKGAEKADWIGAKFKITGPRPAFHWLLKKKEMADGWGGLVVNYPTRLRLLRKVMEEANAHDVAHDLFILERKAERGVLIESDPKSWAPLGPIVLLWCFEFLSDCGRSAMRPFAFLLGTNLFLFFPLYVLLFAAIKLPILCHAISWWLCGVGPYPGQIMSDIFNFMLGHALPLASMSKVQDDVMTRLFGGENDLIEMPFWFGVSSMGQSILGALLLFLFLQAIRNHFRLR
ncbi:MAG: pentapeptide repeat-containing protein [Alphaproteobacteria bacterium]|nr:pentapeptide repeat-containing protein [Alphaproteobacteria bacterium]